MHKFNVLKIGLLAALSVGAMAQNSSATVVIASESFEPGQTNEWIPTIGGTTGAVLTNSGNLFTSSRVLGTQSFVQVDNDTSNTTSTTSTLVFPTLNILAGNFDPQVSFRLAGLGINGSNGVDSDDFVKVTLTIDGVASTSPDLTIQGNSNARWAYSAAQVSGNTVLVLSGSASQIQAPSGGSINATGPNYLTIQLPHDVSTLGMQIALTTTNSSEGWSVDNFAVTSPEPASLSLLGLGGMTMLARRRRKHVA